MSKLQNLLKINETIMAKVGNLDLDPFTKYYVVPEFNSKDRLFSGTYAECVDWVNAHKDEYPRADIINYGSETTTLFRGEKV